MLSDLFIAVMFIISLVINGKIAMVVIRSIDDAKEDIINKISICDQCKCERAVK